MLTDIEMRDASRSKTWHIMHTVHGVKMMIYNPLLPEPFFVTHLPKGGSYTPSLDFCCKASDSYDFSTGV